MANACAWISAGLLLGFSGAHHDVNIVAHEDDDLLFMSPDLAESIQQGNHVRTVYVTAGQYYHTSDPYFLYREEGIRAAYAKMADLPNAWTASNLALTAPRGGRRFVVRELDLDGSDGRISVVFLRLPDGQDAIQRLWNGDPKSTRVFTMTPSICASLDARVDPRGECRAAEEATASYSREDLLDVLTALLADAGADRVRITDVSGAFVYDEHSDHYHTARFGLEAQRRYAAIRSLTTYRTYSIVEEPDNLSLADATAKAEVFDVYGAFDPEMCAACPRRDPGTGYCPACESCMQIAACEWPKPCSPTINYGRARGWVKRQVAMPLVTGPIVGQDGRCLTLRGGEVIMDACVGAEAQSWSILVDGVHVEAGERRDGGQIRTPSGDLCLGTAPGKQRSPWIGVVDCPTFVHRRGVAERWRIDGRQIRAGGTSLCLGLAADGEHLALEECAADPDRWSVPAGAAAPIAPERAPICFRPDQ